MLPFSSKNFRVTSICARVRPIRESNFKCVDHRYGKRRHVKQKQNLDRRRESLNTDTAPQQQPPATTQRILPKKIDLQQQNTSHSRQFEYMHARTYPSALLCAAMALVVHHRFAWHRPLQQRRSLCGKGMRCKAGRGMYEGAPVCTGGGIFPFVDRFEVGESVLDSGTVLQLLDPFMTERRKEMIQKVIDRRTFNILPIVEGLTDSGNVAAVMRSADGMGCGALHCIEPRRQFRKTSERCSAGAEKWLHVKMWNSAEECVHSLHSVGYQVVATHMSADSIPVHEIDWSVPMAVAFGNEGSGLSSSVLDLCDHRAIIPMEGFVESFNISVAAAMVLYEARASRHRLLGRQGDLTPEQKQILQATYYIRHKVHNDPLFQTR